MRDETRVHFHLHYMSKMTNKSVGSFIELLYLISLTVLFAMQNIE